MRLGILGGTFDPIHYGHLFIAEHVRAVLRLDRVVVIANGAPAHKHSSAIACAEDRWAMTSLAVQGNPALEASRVEIDRDGPSYTIDTLEMLSSQYPDASLHFITGVDAVVELPTWHRYPEHFGLCRFVVVARPGHSVTQLAERLPADDVLRLVVLPATHIDISSTDIRCRTAADLPIRYLTPDPVVEYIRTHGLYSDACEGRNPAAACRTT